MLLTSVFLFNIIIESDILLKSVIIASITTLCLDYGFNLKGLTYIKE
jgi:hypothetical protein